MQKHISVIMDLIPLFLNFNFKPVDKKNRNRKIIKHDLENQNLWVFVKKWEMSTII